MESGLSLQGAGDPALVLAGGGDVDEDRQIGVAVEQGVDLDAVLGAARSPWRTPRRRAGGPVRRSGHRKDGEAVD